MLWLIFILYFTGVILATDYQVKVNEKTFNFANSKVLRLGIPFQLYWNSLSPNSTQLTLAVQATPPEQGGWVGVGFNEYNVMVPSIAILAMTPADTRLPTVLAYTLTDRTPEAVQVARGNVIQAAEIGYKQRQVTAVFTILLNQIPVIKTGLDENTGVIYAYANQPSSVDLLPTHREHASTGLSFSSSMPQRDAPLPSIGSKAEGIGLIVPSVLCIIHLIINSCQV